MNFNFYEDDKLDFVLVTDTHFGRTFKEGIPLNRRGEYENRIYDDFMNFLQTKGANKTVIHGGDLFDSPFVSNDVLMRVYQILSDCCYPLSHYYFIAGNHDLSKDESKQGCTSFRILSKLLEYRSNIHFIEGTPEIVENGLLLVPYNHFISADEMVSAGLNGKANAVIGHFDDPVPPTLAFFNGKKFSGHYHKRHIANDGTFFIGSFYPIAFGEETDDSFMETMTLEEYNKRDESELKDKRVRILLKDGEELPTEFSCLQLIGKKEKKEDINIEVKADEDFDFRSLFMECVKDCNIAEELWDRYTKLKGVDNAA